MDSTNYGEIMGIFVGFYWDTMGYIDNQRIGSREHFNGLNRTHGGFCHGN